MGSKERWYWGLGVLMTALGFIMAHTSPEALGGFAAVLSPICLGVYGGGLAKLWAEVKYNNANKSP